METTSDSIRDELEAEILRAITVITADQKASVSHLQRRLKLSYGRAVQIMDHLEKRGLVGPANGGRPRQIFLPKQSDSSALLSVEPETKAIASPVADGNGGHPQTQDFPPEKLNPSADIPVVVDSDGLERAREVRKTVNSMTDSQRDRLFDKGPSDSPIKLCIISYLPKPSEKFHTLSFLENLRRNPPAHPLVTFSDCPDFSPYAPPTVLMKRSIEIPGLTEKQHGVSNLAFYLAFGQSWKLGFTHFLYLEADCRMRSREGNLLHWDSLILAQFMEAQNERSVPLIIGGSMLLWNPFKPDELTAQLANELLDKWNPNRSAATAQERNRWIPTYGARHQKPEAGSGVGCNGAGAIYSVEGLRTIFPEIREPGDNATIVGIAGSEVPFDHEIARRIWQRYKADSFQYVAHLSCMFSSFADLVSTEAERLEMLRSGKTVLIHSVKSAEIQ